MEKSKFMSRLSKSMGGTECSELIGLELNEVLDDDLDQIIPSPTLFSAFVRSSKLRKNYDAEKIKGLFKYVVYLYNDTIEMTKKYGALTYLEKICKCLDYLTISNITELSLEQLNLLLDNNDGNILNIYMSIKENRHTLEEKDFAIYKQFLKENNNRTKTRLAKKVYAYISSLYNENTILQDNVDHVAFLKTISTLDQESVLSMRMFQFLDILEVYSINNFNVSESKGLVNDLSDANLGTSF